MKRKLGRQNNRKKSSTDFVKRMQELSSRIINKMLWHSEKQGTYIKNKHGIL